MSSPINHSDPVNQNYNSDLNLSKVIPLVIRSAGLSEVFIYLKSKSNPRLCNFLIPFQMSFKRFWVNKHFVLIFSDKIHHNTTCALTATIILFTVSGGKTFKMLGIHFTARKTGINSREGNVLFIKWDTLALENTKLADPRWKMSAANP